MPVNDLLEERIRSEIETDVSDVVAPPDLAGKVRHRYRRRSLRRTRVAVVACTGVAIGAISFAVLASGPSSPGRSSIDLAGYSVTLPPGVHASQLEFVPESSSPTTPPANSILVQCKATGVGVMMNTPKDWGPPPWQQPAYTNFVITSSSGEGCVSGLMTLPYGSGTTPMPDQVAPAGTQTVDIDAYPTVEMDASSAQLSDYAYYVQLPASGGGYQDLVVGAIGIPRSDVVALVQQVVAQYERGAPGTTTTTG